MYVRGYLQGSENVRVVTIDKYIAEFPSIFSVYYNYSSVFSDLFRSFLNLHKHFKYVKKLSNEKFLDIREFTSSSSRQENTLY